jgi:3-oxoacyl-[acyl-carrier protein] reductase/meso-butanediol dehydrogenase/(S,S)-butanediol dehydrogenase/diacetyl reductase
MTNVSRRLDGKVATVTGAGRMRGIGRAIALDLAGNGADVVVTAVARPPDTFPEHEREAGWLGPESVAEEIRALGRRAFALNVDVTDPASVQSMVDRTLADLGRIDVLVNNAGLALVSGKHDLWDVSDEDWFREIDVNLNGVFHCCKAVARALVDQKEGGRIINLSSLAGRAGQPQYGAYTPSKFGVVGLTQGLALELAPHQVTVNCIAPGSTDTDMMDGTFRRTGERMNIPFEMVKMGVARFIPLGRQADPSEIAAVVSYLASPAAANITGQTINVDGGIVMR